MFLIHSQSSVGATSGSYAGLEPPDERCMFNPNININLESRLQSDQAFPTVYCCPGRFSPAKAGTPVRHISGLFFKLHNDA